jgi:subtilase family serine protease
MFGRNLSRSLARPATRLLRVRAFRRDVESLETRQMLSATDPSLAGLVTQPTSEFSPSTGTGSAIGFTPSQIQHAYGFDQLAFASYTNSSLPLPGAGQTIAIVDAYDAPNIAADLSNFDAAFGLPGQNGTSDPVSNYLTKIELDSNGNPYANQSTLPSNSGWNEEASLDVEWAHAIAPGAKIILVEANSANLGDMLNAVNFADYTFLNDGVHNYTTALVNAGYTGTTPVAVQVVSMSWGASEWSNEAAFDVRFTTPPNYPNYNTGAGITYVASSGDSRVSRFTSMEYPATSPDVLSVGGTSLTVDPSSNYVSESAWNNIYGASTGGVSRYETRPTYQNGIQSNKDRTVPDVAYNADPTTGVSVLYNNTWYEVGGTSAGAPQWAGLIAAADQGRALAATPKPSLDAIAATMPNLYQFARTTTTYSTDYHDITSGNNGLYRATAGYDLATGLGTPQAAALVSALTSVAAGRGTGTLATPITAQGTASPGFAGASLATGLFISVPVPTGSSTSAAVILVVPPATTVAGTPAIVASNSPTSLSPFSTANNSAIGHTTTGASSTSVTVLSAVPTTSVRPPQPLDSRRAFDFDAWLRLHDEEKPFESPGLSPLDSAGFFIARREAAIGLDLLAIARNAAMLGRVVDAVGAAGLVRDLDPLVKPVRAEATGPDSTPPLDRALTGLVVSLAGAGTMALHNKGRSERRRRQSPSVRVS